MKFSHCFSEKVAISKLTFGCGPLSGVDWGNFDVNDTMAAVAEAADLGVNVFDTADIYGLGVSEELLSKALGSKRHDVVISTKFGVNWAKGVNDKWAKTFYDCSPKRVVEALEASLRRLRLDSIPLYYIHWPDPGTPFKQTAEALQRCQEAGKIQKIGLSNFPLSMIQEISKDIKISAVQAQYSLIDREVEDRFLHICKDLDIAVFTYGPLAQGFLSGKYNRGSKFDDTDCRSRLSHFKADEFQRHQDVINKIHEISKRYDITMSQVALRWVIENPNISSMISGIKTVSQMMDNAGALEFDIKNSDVGFFKTRI